MKAYPAARSGRGRAPPRVAAPPLGADSLAFALDAAAFAIGLVRGGQALPTALNEQRKRLGERMTAQAQGAIQDISYRTMRSLGAVTALIAALVPRPPIPAVGDLLACALTLLGDKRQAAVYPPFTVVDQAVDALAARADPAESGAKGMVNAVLRNFLRQRDALLERIDTIPSARWNYPDWWIEQTRLAYPEQWQQILQAGNVHAPMTLRVNRRRVVAAAYLESLLATGVDATALGDSAIKLSKAMPVDSIPGFREGLVSVQDAAAQRAAPLLELADGMRVLDACAAPGGKSGHLLELAEVALLAIDNDAQRARLIGQNFDRLGLRAAVQVADALAPASWWDGAPFDRILADVPCSASGIVRRHPDIRWLRRASDIPALVDRQRALLDALWPMLAPGGQLLYVTCSIFPQEGERQAHWFERARPDAVRLDAPGQLLPSSNNDVGGCPDPDHDGFFYARFLKR